ncbi:MAG: HK97 gp10 family phage protein [Desulfarculaceae bacterium]
MIEIKLIAPRENPLERLSRRLPAILRKSLEQALEVGLRAVQRRMGAGGPRIRSGRLLRSLRKRISGQGLRLRGELMALAPYAGAQEHGAVIQARKGKYLKFQVQGRWVQSRRVILPARPYLRPGSQAAAQALEKFFFENLEQELS